MGRLLEVVKSSKRLRRHRDALPVRPDMSPAGLYYTSEGGGSAPTAVGRCGPLL
jgi:hypothetical protein